MRSAAAPESAPGRRRWLVAALFVLLLVGFAAGLWGTLLRPSAYELRGTVVARAAPDLLLIRHEAVAALGMEAMDLMAISGAPEILDAAQLSAGDRVKLAVRPAERGLVLLRVERVP